MTNRNNEEYTTTEIRIMREMVESEEYSIAQIAERLGRTYNAIGQQIHRYKFRIRRARYTPEECERILTCDDNELLAREMDRTIMMIVGKRYKLKKAMRCK
ncbi:MAG: hypothetical protein Tp118SUR00d2C21406351_54 [Prokaryotic dsDNA virus sp.]|nr:MAG: hypothetical protein Tp118SUR00d2C21406351_54 [Prokaryotic dsDNA virus sp.]